MTFPIKVRPMPVANASKKQGGFQHPRLVLSAILAHLSRRLIGELIVHTSIRSPSVVRPSSTISNDFSPEAVRPILFIFHIWRL